jgi:hypothetical protein
MFLFDSYDCRAAATNSHLQVLDWLWKNGIDHVLIQTVAVNRAALRGAITVLEWAKDCGYDFTNDGNNHACMYAARNGNLPELQ